MKKKRYRIGILLIFTVLASVLTIAVSANDIGSAGAVLAGSVTMTKTNLLGEKAEFRETDFKCALDIANFKSITVQTIPPNADGTLYYNGRRVTEGQTVKRQNISGLYFTPANKEVDETQFSVCVNAGSQCPVQCRLRFIDYVNYAPKTGNKEVSTVSTKQNVTYFGVLDAEDPESDALSYRIISQPENGRTVVAASTGHYQYYPNEGYTGKDSFVYVAEDEYGNYSQPTEIEINVTERKTSAEYEDMKASENYNAALDMTEKGIMAGTLLGDDFYFLPEEEVSRAQFVVMAMKAKGIKQDTTLKKSYFDDNESIPECYVSYIATAQKIGIINGSFSDGKLLFRPNDTITKYEASVVLNRLFEQEKDADLTVIAEQNNIPAFARAGVSAMIKAGILSSCEEAMGNVTREDAAKYLYTISD